MGLFDRFKRNSDDDDVPSTGRASREATADLRAFLSAHEGVEGYVEPQTSVYSMTLLLVAGDGDHLRRPVKSAKAAHKLCEDAGVPLYDARKVGYPQRMKDFQKGVKRRPVSLEDLPPLDVTDERDS